MSAPLDPPGGPASVTEYSEYSLYFRAGRVDRPMPASRDWASAHICTGTGLAPATSAPGMGSPSHICTGTRLAPFISAPGLGCAPGGARAGRRPSRTCRANATPQVKLRIRAARRRTLPGQPARVGTEAPVGTRGTLIGGRWRVGGGCTAGCWWWRGRRAARIGCPCATRSPRSSSARQA